MAIAQIQKTQPITAGTPKAPATLDSQPKEAPSSLKKADTISLTAEVQQRKAVSESPGRGHRLPYPQGSASANMLAYYNSRTGELQALPMVQGRIGLWTAGEDDPGDINKEGVCSLGLALGSNGKTTVASAYLAETVIDTEVGRKNRPFRLDVEFGFSHIRDGYVSHSGDMYGYNKDQVGYNTAHIGFDVILAPKLNLMTGFDMSSMVFNPYVGVGGRWQSKDH